MLKFKIPAGQLFFTFSSLLLFFLFYSMVIHLKDTTNIISDAKSVWKVCKDLLEAEDAVDQDKEHFCDGYLVN